MLTPLCDGVWFECGPVSFLGLRLTATMTVLRIGDGTLLVHSPLPLTVERKTAVSKLGHVAHLYAPNTFHHQWMGEWMGAFPAACVHAPAALAAKRADLRIDRFHDQVDAQEIDGVDEIPVRGFRLRETVLVHRASRTAVLADLVHNIGRPDHKWTKLYSKTMGFYDRVALSRVVRWTSFDDRGAARASVDALLDHAFDRLIVGHGQPIACDARDVLAASTAWLPQRRSRA
ncbi:MAG: hypothetical protein RLZZ450_6716 [Pseudomonadota bacterium]|jgi:hypothetical protein